MLVNKNIIGRNRRALFYLPQVIYVITAASVFFCTFRKSNRYAQSHWLMNYDGGFIKRGLVGAFFQVEQLAVYFGVPVVSIIDILATIFLVLFFFAANFIICFRIAKLSSAGLTLCPVFLTLPLLWVSARYNGYYDQFIYLFMMGIGFFLLKKNYFVVGVLAAIAILIHESTVVFYFPLLVFWIMLQGFLGEKKDVLALCRNPAWWWAVVFPLIIFGGLVVYHALWLPVENIKNHIESIVSRNPDLFNDSESYLRTFLTSFSQWYDSESPGFFLRLFGLYSFLMAYLPLFFLMTVLYFALPKMKNVLVFCVCCFLLMFSPISLLLVAWDADRIWSYPVFLALMFIWILLEMKIEMDFFKTARRALSIAGFFIVVFMLLIMLLANQISLIWLLLFFPILLLSVANIFLDKLDFIFPVSAIK